MQITLGEPKQTHDKTVLLSRYEATAHSQFNPLNPITDREVEAFLFLFYGKISNRYSYVLSVSFDEL